MPAVTQRCEDAVPLEPTAATVQDCIVAWTMVEVVELSNLDSGGSHIDCDRFNSALLAAYNYLESAKLTMPAVGSLVINANLNRWMLMLARYYLDTVRRRPDVTADYKAVLTELDRLSKLKGSAAVAQTPDKSNEARVYVHTSKSPVWTEQSTQKYKARNLGVY